jgi:hypothetical protein
MTDTRPCLMPPVLPTAQAHIGVGVAAAEPPPQPIYQAEAIKKETGPMYLASTARETYVKHPAPPPHTAPPRAVAPPPTKFEHTTVPHRLHVTVATRHHLPFLPIDLEMYISSQVSRHHFTPPPAYEKPGLRVNSLNSGPLPPPEPEHIVGTSTARATYVPHKIESPSESGTPRQPKPRLSLDAVTVAKASFQVSPFLYHFVILFPSMLCFHL